MILSNFCIVSIVEISIFQAVAKEKHWLLGTLITILIQGIAHDKASLDPYLYAYQDKLKPLKLRNFHPAGTFLYGTLQLIFALYSDLESYGTYMEPILVVFDLESNGTHMEPPYISENYTVTVFDLE